MRTSVDTTAKFGTTNLESTTWADTQDTVNTKRNTKLNDKIDVDYFRCVHIIIPFWLLPSTLIAQQDL